MFTKKDILNIESAIIIYTIKVTGSKRNAAKSMNMALDTIGKYTGNLEAELGSKLIEASEQGCVLTKLGEMVAFQVSVIQKCLQNIYALKAIEKGMKGDVYVACDQRINSHIHAVAIKRLCKNYPDIRLHIDNCNGFSDMTNAKYDIYLSYEIPKNDELAKINSREIPYKFFASQEYFKTNDYPKDMKDLLAHHHIIVRKEDWQKMRVTLSSKEHKGIFFTDNPIIINDVACESGGIGIMPYYFKNTEKNLVCLENIDCKATNTIYLSSPKNRKDVPRVRAVLNYYKDLISNL